MSASLIEFNGSQKISERIISMTTATIGADLLFVVQVVCTVIFGGAQFKRILKTTKGLSVTWFLFWELFLILNLVLAFDAHAVQPSRVTWQTLASYLLWTVVVTADLAVLLWRWPGWKRGDTITVLLSGAGTIVLLLIAFITKQSLADPMMKGWLAVFCKAIPQVMLACVIWNQRGGGPPMATIITGHVTVSTRLGQLAFSIAEAGWDTSRIASAFSEAANELSWILVTVFWAKYRKAAK